MNIHGEDDHGDVFFDEDDILKEIHVDEEDLPDADDGFRSDVDLGGIEEDIWSGLVQRMPMFGSNVTCGDFTPDGTVKLSGKLIGNGSDDASLRIWNQKPG